MFEKKAETKQSECDGDRLRGGTDVLGCVSVHRNLMDKESIAVRQRVEREFERTSLRVLTDRFTDGSCAKSC